LIKKIVFSILILFFVAGCGEEKGKLRVWLTDAPPPQDVENIYLTVLLVGIVDLDNEVATISSELYGTTVDIVRLASGYAMPLTYNSNTGSSYADIAPGDYKSILLLLAQINSVVREDSFSDTLLIPYDSTLSDSTYNPFRFELELENEFTILPGEYRTIVIDFDASKSINWETSPYELNPQFRIFASSDAGFIKGNVKALEDDSEVPVKFAVLQAVNLNDTMTTLSDTAGGYLFFLPEGTYDLSVSAEGYVSDTTYEGITVIRDSVLPDCDFMLW
jgi:hypothetical protein